MIKYHTESLLSGILILAIGLTFNGFDSTRPTAANADFKSTHRNEEIIFNNIIIPEKQQIAKSIKKTYKKNEQLSPKELKSILYEAGFRGERLREAWGTAMKESTGRPRSHNDNPDTGDNSYGLFQINMIGDLGPARLQKYNLKSNEDLFDPLVNAKIAYQMSNKGKNWSAWHGITDRTLEWMQKFPN